MTLAASLQKYRMHAKEQAQEDAHKQLLAQGSQVLGGEGLDSMLRKLGNVGLQAMLKASGMATQYHTEPGMDAASAKQVRSTFLLWLGLTSLGFTKRLRCGCLLAACALRQVLSIVLHTVT